MQNKLNIKKNWLVVYTRPRCERRVHNHFLGKGLETYCPLNKVSKKWSDRLKKVEEPLFKSYVFVRVMDEEKSLVRMTNGVVNFVYSLNKPAIIKDKEIETIKRFMNEHERVEAQPLEPRPNQKVRIYSGVLMDKEARILRILGNRVEVVIESLGYKLVANIDKSNIEGL